MKKRKNRYIPPKTGPSKKPGLFSMHGLIALLIVVNLFTSSVTLSKFATSSNPYVDLARVAAFQVELTPLNEGDVTILKGVQSQKAICSIRVNNLSEVAVTCSAVLTYSSADTGTAGKVKVSCQLGENTQTSAVALSKTNTFNNIGEIPPCTESELKIIFETNKYQDDNYINEFVYGLKLALTVNQID